jgi:Flp pilus assembly protein TadD
MAKKKITTPNKTTYPPTRREEPLTFDAISSKPQNTNRWLLPTVPLYVEAIIIFLLGFLWYANTLPNGYAVDDFDVLLGNKSVQGGVKYIPNILRDDAKAGEPVGAEEVNLFAGGRYRPLSLIMFAIEKTITGENSPFLGHFNNVLCYAIMLALWWWIFRKYCFPNTPEVAFLGLALFAIHPVHTEVVANIKSRDEIICLLFLGLTTLFTFKILEKPAQKILYAGLGSAMFFLALMSRETAFTFLLILPLTLYFFGTSKGEPLPLKKVLNVSLPVLASFVVYFAIRHSVLSQYKELPFYDQIRDYRDELNDPFIHATFTERYATIFYLLLKYLVMLFYPHPLSWDYSFNQIAYRNLASPEVWISLLINGGLLIYAFYRLPKRDPLSYAILFYFLAMSIVSNVFFAIGVAFAERFLFLPSLGWALALAIVIDRGVRRFPSLKGAMAGLLVVVGLLAFFKTFTRNKEWESHEKLALKDVITCPKSAKTNINVGDVYLHKARSTTDNKQQLAYLDSAKKYYKRTLDILPKWYNADSGYRTASLAIGKIYYDQAQQNDAQNGPVQTTIDLLEKAAQAAPMWGSPRMMLSVFYESKLNDPDKAYQKIVEATTVAPDSVQYWAARGRMAFQRSLFKDAMDAFEQCTRLRKNVPEFWFDYGVAALQAGDMTRAKVAFTQVLALDPKRQLPPQALALMK